MIKKSCTIFFILFLIIGISDHLFAQFGRSRTSKVIVPKVEYVEDNLSKTKPSSSVSPTIILENDNEDMFEDYQGKATIDETPQYKSSKPNYVLEKIVYTETEIIFSLAIYFEPQSYSNAIFYPRNHADHWFLKNTLTGRRQSFKSVRRIKKDGQLEAIELKDYPLSIKTNSNQQTVFTCRVHFDRPAATWGKEVHLIEGRGKANNKNHFNFFNIKLK